MEKDIQLIQRFKKGDIVSLTEEGKRVLGRFLRQETYEIMMHSKDSSPRAEIVTITDDNKDTRNLDASFLTLVSRP